MLTFGTKAETLLKLQRKLHTAYILPQLSFTVRDWNVQKNEIISRFVQKFQQTKVVVRSSALSEDRLVSSEAGKYKTVLNVVGLQEFEKAVEIVIQSFEDKNLNNQILVQSMLRNVKISGVVFTLDPNTMGNYYVINYDDQSGVTDSITSGSSKYSKLFYCFKDQIPTRHPFLRNICLCLQELEALFQKQNLDVEFAIDTSDKLYIFQVRPLCIAKPFIPISHQKKALLAIYNKIQEANRKKPFLLGERTIYGVMPDWNPAEMIGIRPKPLALSLYKEIITDTIWAYQRDNYGYRNLRSFPLLIDFGGLPYIDVRVSLNSFLPKSLDTALSEKLVNYYLCQLEKYPSRHDKIEFEIVFTCYTLDLPERIQVLKQYGFTEEEITQILHALRSTTRNIIDAKEGLWKADYEKLRQLEQRYSILINSDLDIISKIYWLLEDCKRYGTLPFAGLARAGFIAVQLLHSFVNKGILTQKEYDLFMKDIHTISSDIQVEKETFTKEAFLNKYGHLRPGTYDITSKRYDEAPELYFSWQKAEQKIERLKTTSVFKLSLEQIECLQQELKVHGLSEDVLETFHFIRTAIEGREYGKFVFTKNLSEAIRLFGLLGMDVGFSIEDCSYADISILKQLYASCEQAEALLHQSITYGKNKYQITESITLPPLLFDGNDVFSFHYPASQPNFITLKSVTGEVIHLENGQLIDNMKNKIIIMSSADPGYDWIFSHHILGFITKYGGANSHMAIRAGELGIPAVIGVGETLFEQLYHAEVLQIDAAIKKVNILK